MLPNVSVAPNRNKLPHYILWAGPGCIHLVVLYCLMVFIHEAHVTDVTPSSVKVKIKRHPFSFLFLEGRVCYTMCKLLEQLLTVRTLHQFSGIIFHDGVYWRNHMWGPSSGKLETKNIFFSFLILAGHVCYTMC